MAQSDQTWNPTQQMTRVYERAEQQAAEASEHLVGTKGFASLLGQLAENGAALTRMGNDAMDLVLRNLRLASRRDVVRLARQLARTEDKLERVLVELEELRDELAQREASRSGNGRGQRSRSAGSGSGSRSSGRSSNGRGRSGSRAKGSAAKASESP